MKNIVLIGMPGSGKSTIGEKLSNLIGADVVSMDKQIEKECGMIIKDIFSKFGESYFRKKETEAALALSKRAGIIIDTGGGVVTSEENMLYLKKNGIVVFLDRPVNEIAKSVDNGLRPLLAGRSGRLHEIYAQRIELYKKYADIVCNCGNNFSITAQELALSLKNLWHVQKRS